MRDNKSFSVILPVDPARESFEDKIAEQLKAQDYPGELLEIIVVRQGLNPAHKRNTGAGQAGGEYLLFLDDDTGIPAGLLKTLNRVINEYQADVSGGPNLGFAGGNIWQRMIDVAFASRAGFGKGAARFKKGTRVMKGDEDNLTACLLCVSRKIFSAVNGFDTALFPGEEVDLIRRLRARGCRMLFHPDIYVHHRRRKNLRLLAEQMFHYGRARFLLFSRNFSGAGISYLLPLLFILYLMCLPLLQFCWAGFITGLLLYTISVLALCTFKFFTGQIALQEIIFLFLTFGSIHCAYGFGQLAGLLKSIRKIIPAGKRPCRH